MPPRHLLRTAAVFVATGAASRFSLRHVETRWQIVAFWTAAAAYQYALRPARGQRGSAAALALAGISATAAIGAMKVAIEGKL